MKDDKKEKLTLKVLEERLLFLGNIITEIQEDRIKELPVSAPKIVNAEAVAPPVIVKRIFRIATNGVKFRVESSTNGEITWSTAGTRVLVMGSETHKVTYFRSYEKAVRYIHKEFGLSATILEREWRAV